MFPGLRLSRSRRDQRRNLVSKLRGSVVWGRGPRSRGRRGGGFASRGVDSGASRLGESARLLGSPACRALGSLGTRGADSHPEAPETRTSGKRCGSRFSLLPGHCPRAASTGSRRRRPCPRGPSSGAATGPPLPRGALLAPQGQGSPGNEVAPRVRGRAAPGCGRREGPLSRRRWRLGAPDERVAQDQHKLDNGIRSRGFKGSGMGRGSVGN